MTMLDGRGFTGNIPEYSFEFYLTIAMPTKIQASQIFVKLQKVKLKQFYQISLCATDSYTHIFYVYVGKCTGNAIMLIVLSIESEYII